LSRGDLTDSEWHILNPLLPDRGDRGPPISDKRRMVNGILWVLRTGAPWRDMPERYGNWNSVFVRFTSGLLDLLLLALAWSEGVGYSKKVKLGGHADGSPPGSIGFDRCLG
jgi:transposase